ncbi:hypothetical protein, partial [Alistipes finegoldii]|uniref:hypothetical protein n=1 Tax=Alistipes finegoldii TaxID=214856 RepID=UPI003AB81468
MFRQEVVAGGAQTRAAEDEKQDDYLLAELNYKRFMFKKLCILLIFSKLNEIKHLIDKYRMHN